MRKSFLEAEVERDLEVASSNVGLNLDQVRIERRQVAPPPTAKSESVPEGPTSALGKAVWDVLFRPDIPHPHHVDFKSNLDALVRHCEKLPLTESLAKHSQFFGRSRYIFSSSEPLPVVRMKNLEELELELEAKRDCVPVRFDSDIYSAVKKSKKEKKSKKTQSESVSAPDDDLDMFGGFTSSAGSLVLPPEDISGPIFGSHADSGAPADDLEAVREALRARAAVHVPEETSFGEKLDVSKFGVAEEKDEPKHKKRKENEIFQKVMKKLNS